MHEACFGLTEGQENCGLSACGCSTLYRNVPWDMERTERGEVDCWYLMYSDHGSDHRDQGLIPSKTNHSLDFTLCLVEFYQSVSSSKYSNLFISNLIYQPFIQLFPSIPIYVFCFIHLFTCIFVSFSPSIYSGKEKKG